MKCPSGIRRELWKKIEALLNASKLPWEIENGSRHYKIWLAGKMIDVKSKDNRTDRDWRQLESRIRQRVREVNACEKHPAPDTGKDTADRGRAVSRTGLQTV